ncbi:MAG: hypothetical protein ACOX4M_06510 [Acetivibrionales bacterium]
MKIYPKILYISNPFVCAKVILDQFSAWNLAIDQKQAASLEDYLDMIKNRHWDIIISEYQYPGFTAFDISDALKDSIYRFNIIVLYDDLPDDKLMDLITAGISDCIQKDNLCYLRNVIYRTSNNIHRFGSVLRDKYADIGYLSARIAHEINNPLGFVNSNFDILRKYCRSFNELISAYESFKEQITGGRHDSAEKHLEIIEEIKKGIILVSPWAKFMIFLTNAVKA